MLGVIQINNNDGVPVLLCFISSVCKVVMYSFKYNTPPESVLTTDGGNRINGVQDRREKDIILGGLFTVHNDAEGSAGPKCGNRVWGQGIELLEAMFYALDNINSDPHLLTNITLRYDIRDTCQSRNIALDESVGLVFTNTDAESGTCRPLEASGNDSIQIPVAATIGPLESFISIPVASFFRLFQMPQVSYASTSTELNNRDQYGYFGQHLRTMQEYKLWLMSFCTTNGIMFQLYTLMISLGHHLIETSSYLQRLKKFALMPMSQ